MADALSPPGIARRRLPRAPWLHYTRHAPHRRAARIAGLDFPTMMATIRAFLKSWFATFVLGILIIASAVFGISSSGGGRFGGGQRTDAVAAAGDLTLPDIIYQRAMEQRLNQ